MMTTEAEGTSLETPRIVVDPRRPPVNADQLRLFAQRPDVPLETKTALNAAAWLAEVAAFRDREEQFSPPDHRVLLIGLIATGEEVVWLIKKHGMDVRQFKFKSEDLDATLESLHTAFWCEYGPKNSQNTNELISQLFDGARS